MICELIIKNKKRIYYIYTYTLLEASEFRRGQGVRLSNDRDNIDTGREATHKFDVHLPQTITIDVSLILSNKIS